MRDMQSRYSHYLNVKYRDTPWVMIAPLFGVKDIDHFAPYLRMGPVNWTPRFDARFLDAKGFREFLRYLETNPIRAGVAQQDALGPPLTRRLRSPLPFRLPIPFHGSRFDPSFSKCAALSTSFKVRGTIHLDDRVTLGPTAMKVLAKKTGLKTEDL